MVLYEILIFPKFKGLILCFVDSPGFSIALNIVHIDESFKFPPNTWHEYVIVFMMQVSMNSPDFNYLVDIDEEMLGIFVFEFENIRKNFIEVLKCLFINHLEAKLSWFWCQNFWTPFAKHLAW